MTYSKIIHSSAPPGDTSSTIGVIVWRKCKMLGCWLARRGGLKQLKLKDYILRRKFWHIPSSAILQVSTTASAEQAASAWDSLERREQDESQTVGCHKTGFTIASEKGKYYWLSRHWIFHILSALSWSETQKFIFRLCLRTDGRLSLSQSHGTHSTGSRDTGWHKNWGDCQLQTRAFSTSWS